MSDLTLESLPLIGKQLLFLPIAFLWTLDFSSQVSNLYTEPFQFDISKNLLNVVFVDWLLKLVNLQIDLWPSTLIPGPLVFFCSLIS